VKSRCLFLLAVSLLGAAVIAARPAANAPRVVHVFVALADNQHQGIVPVKAVLGNGEDPAHNLYWGAAFGVKTFFLRSTYWELVSCSAGPKRAILERCLFKRRGQPVYLLADAYRGSEIRAAVSDFLSAAAGLPGTPFVSKTRSGELSLPAAGSADLVAYVGHDGLMDFQLPAVRSPAEAKPPDAIVLACASKQFFGRYFRVAGAKPLLWTTGLMAPEAYTLEASLEGWVSGENPEAIRQRAARTYDHFQKCGIRRALRLFSAGW